MNPLNHPLLHPLLLGCCIGATLLSCEPKPATEPTVALSSPKHSNLYHPPVFADDNRIKQIKSIAPELQKIIADHAKANNIPGIAYGVVVDNELVVAGATGVLNTDKQTPATALSSFKIASMTKSFTAMAILKLKEEGKLSLNDPVSKYIPEMADLAYLTRDASIIDIENLLTMTAGFPEDNPWGDRQLDESDQMLIDLIAEGLSFSNATSYKFEYSNTGYALLGTIVSRVSGKSYQNYIRQTIFEPLGMKQTYWEYENVPSEQLAIGYRWEDEQWKLEPMLHDGAFGAMGGLITSIQDFSKYVSFHLSAWPPRSSQDRGPIKRSSLRDMQTAQFSRLYAKASDFNGDPCPAITGYGYGLGITEFCHGLKQVGHGGALPGFGSNYKFYPEYGIGLMAFCNLTYTSPWPYREIGKLLFETLDLEPRKLPVSNILARRQAQIVQLLENWDPALEAEIWAENVYLDQSREDRVTEINAVLKKAGPIVSIDKIEPENQLRGRFKMKSKKGVVGVFFTLTPEKDPKVQQLDISFQRHKKE